MYITPSGKKLVTVISGDGIGPEVVHSAQRIIEATGAPIAWEERHAGESVFKQGIPSGVLPETIESIRKTRVVLKGPLGTPIGYGEKSANVTLRKLFETYANIRPVRKLPGVKTPFSGRGIDLVVVRENIEDVYAGIEHIQTPGVASTSVYTDAIIANLGKQPTAWKIRERKPLHMPQFNTSPDFVHIKQRRVVGIDIFIASSLQPQELGPNIEQVVADSPFVLKMISNRGTKVYPAIGAITDCVDQYRCSFLFKEDISHLHDDQIDASLLHLIQRIITHYRWAHLEKLQEFDGVVAFTKAQGED